MAQQLPIDQGNESSLIVVGATAVGLLGCVAIAGVMLTSGMDVPDWLLAIISTGLGGGLTHAGSRIGA